MNAKHIARPTVTTHFMTWIRSYLGWAAGFLVVAALLIGAVANAVVVPLVLLCFAAALATTRYWHSLRSLDLWAIEEWISTKVSSMGIREWHAPYRAVEFFCDPAIVAARNDAAAEMNTIMMELIRDQHRNPDGSFTREGIHPKELGAALALDERKLTGLHSNFDAAKRKHDQNNTVLARDLLRQLIVGNLIAKGLPSQADVTKAERLIPASRWRILQLDLSKAEAFGHGLSYVGVVIAKASTR